MRRLERHTVRAPAEHGHSLQVPALADARLLVESNRSLLKSWNIELAGRSLATLREQLLSELPRLALQHTRRYRDVSLEGWDDQGLILSGHQPRLFHPGVWFKNYALSSLGQHGMGTPINLVVDNDLCGLPAVAVPVVNQERAAFTNCHYDQPGDNVPFELSRLTDESTFRSFPHRLGQLLKPLVAAPLVHRLWEHWSELPSDLRGNLGLGLAAARHKLENDFGWQTLELPLSQLCRTEAFACFLAELLLRAKELRTIHNSALEEYRRLNRIRSKSHPVPALALEGNWCEVPFWVYSAAKPRRQRLFVQSFGEQLELSDRDGWNVKLDKLRLTEQLQELLQGPICIRTRALTTTLFSRVLACDLFLHGIGGAKYDELTNEIGQQFFGMPLPVFMTLTATVRLPGHERPTTAADVVRHEVLRRELKYHPEQHLSPSDSAAAANWVAAKRQLLATRGSNSNLRSWRRELEQVDAALAPYVAKTAEQLAGEIERLKEVQQRDAVLGSREISLCCFDAGLAAQIEAAARNHSSASR
ncbi:MAG: hypothetical protein ACKO0N_04495 [Planctomycetota bacterium]